MKPTDRINLITQVSKRLAVEEWSIIDLTLNQFGLPTANAWDSDKISYIIAMVKDANDDLL